MKKIKQVMPVLMAMLLMSAAWGHSKTEFTPKKLADENAVAGNGLVVVELEGHKQLGEWKKGTTAVNNQTIEYIYSEKEFFNSTGNQELSYKVKISIPGTYKFIWHCKVGAGTSPTDNNDTWLKIDGAASFYAQKPNSPLLQPKGVCINNCPNGVGEKGWFKVYSNGTTKWSWRTKTSDKDPHDIYATFDKPGIYTVLISARSAHQFLDRFVLYNVDLFTEAAATDLSLPATD